MAEVMKTLWHLGLACLFTSCGHSPQSGKPIADRNEPIWFVPPSISMPDGRVVPFMSVEEANQQNAEIFRRENAAFLTPAVSAGDFARTTRAGLQRRQTLMHTAGLQLELNLGKETHTAPEGTNGHRTFSRYILKTAAGRILAEAESILAAGLDYEVDPGVSVFSDPAERTLLTMEYRTGSPPRYIIFTAQTEAAGAVRYVEIPLRVEASVSPMHFSLPNILGIRDGKVYLHEDGQTYAFPLSSLKEVTSLEFSIG